MHPEQDRTSAAAAGTTPVNRDAAAYFEQHAEHYQQNHYRGTRRTFINVRHELILNVVDGLRLPAGAAVLDAGCGPGNLTVEFARRGFAVTALDAANAMIDLARANVERAGLGPVAFHQGSIEALPFPDAQFDMVCSAGVIEYLPDYDRSMAEFHRVLKPGGVLILPTTNLLAPAYFLRPVIEPLGRLPMVARLLGIQPRRFRVYLHYLPKFRAHLRQAGFELELERHFYLNAPRPLDRLLHPLSAAVERHLEQHTGSMLRHLAEGYVALCRKPAGASGRSA